MAGAGAVAAATALSAVTAAPASADPSTDEVRERINELEEEFSRLNDDYNAAQEDHEAAERRLEELEADIAEADEALAELRDGVRAVALAAYTGGDPSSPAYLLGTSDPESVLDSTADLNYLSASQREALDSYLEERDELEALQSEAADAEDQAGSHLEEAEEARAEGEESIAEQEDLLEELTAEERQEETDPPPDDSGDSQDPPSYGGNASGDAAVALEYAYAQVGDAYCWGGEGPDCFDCSGLTQSAWSQAGVSLPRTAAQQYNAGTRVTWDAMQPGDLMFFYDSSAPSHVGMYAGNGMMVHASSSSKPVMEVELGSYYRSNFVGAVRP